LLYNHHFIIVLLAELSMKESQVGDLKKNIKLQQAETSKAKLELKTSFEEIDKLKAGFDADRAAWETDKATLAKRTEEAEAALKPVTEELFGLKQHIIQMTSAIFGKTHTQLLISLCIYLTRLVTYHM
jgi:hypothetical protein